MDRSQLVAKAVSCQEVEDGVSLARHDGVIQLEWQRIRVILDTSLTNHLVNKSHSRVLVDGRARCAMLPILPLLLCLVPSVMIIPIVLLFLVVGK